MDIDEEFDSLCLPLVQKSLAWEARAKILWGDPSDDVQTWLAGNDIDPFTAQQIVAIAVRERAIAIRVKGARDLVCGILVGATGAGIGIGSVMIVNLGPVRVPINGLAVLVAFAFLAFMYGAHLTWRGLARVLGGARVKGAVSDVGD